MEKEKENPIEEIEEKEQKPKGSIIKKILILVVSLLILFFLFLILLKFNVFGLGSKLAPSMRNLPLSHFYLPSMEETGEVEIDPETGEPIAEEPEEDISELKEILKLTESELKKKEDEADILLKQIKNLRKENERLAVFEAKQVEFQKDKQEFDALIVEKGGKPDFAEWYQKINPDNAAKLYQQTMVELDEQEELDRLTKVYTEMKPKAAAKVLETMGNTRLEMVAMIIKNLDTNQAGKIMSEIDPKIAARITAYLYPENN